MGISTQQKTARKDKRKFFFSMSPGGFYIDKTKTEQLHENQYNNKNIWGYRHSKKRPDKDNTLYKCMGISVKQKTAKKKTIHFRFKLDPLWDN